MSQDSSRPRRRVAAHRGQLAAWPIERRERLGGRLAFYDRRAACFEGSGTTFEQALEAAFVDLCKKYPGGKVSILAEGFEPEGKAVRGKTVGFELDTGSA